MTSRAQALRKLIDRGELYPKSYRGVAKQHLAFARELLATGSVTFDQAFQENEDLLEMGLYDDLIRDWATKTGRETRQRPTRPAGHRARQP